MSFYNRYLVSEAWSISGLTRHSTRLTSKSTLENPFFLDDPESTLNPQGSNFPVQDWLKMLLEIRSRDSERYPHRTAGLAFKNLSVHGFGSPTDYQKDILRDFEGLVRSGEMLVVLGRPGSGCSTFFKTITGEMNGIQVSEDTTMNYQGISAKDMQKAFRGEAIYTAEVNVHFLSFRDVVMAMLGLSHAINIRVGNDFIRGVSGGERKRVSIALATLSQAPLSIYFGYTTDAKMFFVDMGFECPGRQTTADFLISLTRPSKRLVRPEFEGRVPCTPDEFATAGKRTMQAKNQRVKSPYTISIWQQVSLVSALLFFAVLLNAFSSVIEILTLYAQRPIIEKQSRYGFYYPFVEALINLFTFNMPLYLMTYLRHDAGAFFTFWLFLVVTTFTMLMIFRTMAATSCLFSQALVPAAIIMLGMVMYTGFTNPTRNILGCFMVNEFVGRDFECAGIIPSSCKYETISMQNRICSTVGAESGSIIINGAMYLEMSFEYTKHHFSRNLGIIIAFIVFFAFTYLVGTEYISEQKSTGEVLLFRQRPIQPASAPTTDEFTNRDSPRIQKQTAISHWEDVCYDIKIKGQPRTILDHVDSWVKPGTCTALIGVSRAGKTTLLDILAIRVTISVQQDPHLAILIMREALRFSILLRQPAHLIIKLLGMEAYADAIVGVPGEGLNVEQRKRLTIGPTSGLDSQTTFLCTIHQPLAMLFQRFDRLLLLTSGGRTIYFGEIGENSTTLLNYFVRNGAHALPSVIGAAPGSYTDIDWVKTWRGNPEYAKVKDHLAELKAKLSSKSLDKSDPSALGEFAAPFFAQLWECLVRVFAQCYRTPNYIWSKFALCTLTSLYIRFSFFKASTFIQGLQNQMFSRSLYKVRERLSKAYSWKAFMIANILYYPIGLYNNAKPTNTVTKRGGLMFLLLWIFLLFTSTFVHIVIAGIELAETGGNVASMLFSLCLIFCGVSHQQTPCLASGSSCTGCHTGLAGTDVVCEATCGDYMPAYLDLTGSGYLLDQDATSQCAICTMDKTDTFLLNFGLMWVYIFFNIAGVVFITGWPVCRRARRRLDDMMRGSRLLQGCMEAKAEHFAA
ncbi:hypothetical protein BJX99DRAFT_249516 [Aspergillus californicus]